MAMPADEEDRHFAVAHGAWRQFHGLHLDDPAPTQPEIDARLLRYQRAHETGAMADFGAAALLLAGVGKGLADGTRAFARADAPAEILVFVLTCILVAVIGAHSLVRVRRAVEQRTIAQRIGTESLAWSKIDSMFADTREPAVRAYLHSVRGQGRPLRRAETAVLLERAGGARPLDDTDGDAFRSHVRGRYGPARLELGTALACLLAVASTALPGFDPGTLAPALLMLGAWCLAEGLGTALRLFIDPWGLRGGGAASRRLRLELAADLVPQAAVVLAVVATTAGLAGLGG
ncbi:MAG: hypothetical protein U5K43_07885 [Halofilum sp. (in: g-proteobacteria)]|nr:hypothetical protein [Halofilum sp. (in: g-proteobacteria)]